MNRRTFLKATAVTPLGIPEQIAAQDTKNISIREGAEEYFDALPATKSDRNDTVVACANRLCAAEKTVSNAVIDAVVNGGASADTIVRRVQFGVRILNEYEITDTVDEAMVAAGRRDLGQYTRYLPLVGSFNNLCDAACGVETPNPDPEAVKDFLFAAASFGLEVLLWVIGTPYKMAWRGTRFVANRTFLRFANHGCTGCFALVMSELHWAIRGSVYGDVVTEDTVEFVWQQIQEVESTGREWGYDVNLDYSSKEIRSIVQDEAKNSNSSGSGVFPQENRGLVERLLPNFELPNIEFEIDIPTLSDFL